ncbi:MAG: hypothetical protein IJO63_03760 [Bacilli bacterium]|nr:hypothetical protein [Bacilli bacterium]
MRKFILNLLAIALFLAVSVFIIDIGSVFLLEKPIFAKKEVSSDKVNVVYRGIFFDTYNCIEYSVPQIKVKGTKFACAGGRTELGNVVNIIDKTKDMDDFVCAEALESFYTDDEYTYYYSCMKGEHIVVQYESGYEETVTQALKFGAITISDLDEHSIYYYKQEKTKE